MLERENDVTRELCLRTLAQYVREDGPRLFAIYGVYHSLPLETVCGWGLEWDADHGGAVFYDPDTRLTWRADSAQKVLQRYRMVADARIVLGARGRLEP
ncbi:hypothetical protein SAMN05216266_101230 [Amycolatopsis marina]|uniref:Uncharacterized protein n=1 Tax=Amycolatopsis marina TaxID=490629 RepID=A0A1I0VG67_9PSEU|nr:hypothetical protein [Amycolatopsis marina]SFA75355.1 hypothetical protein SAMN05216266_101230 [Amycolatopsis marina]